VAEHSTLKSPATLKPSCLLLFSLPLLCFTGLITITRAAAVGTAEQYNEALTGWKRTLEQYVDVEGRVNFLSLSSDITDLKHFVEVLAVFGPATQAQAFATRNDVLAYHINAYNALAMYAVIDRGIPDNFNNILKRAWFFKFRDIVIAGQTTNLYDYENKVIRPFNDPRVHFALNCMVRGCPRLPRYPFRGETLQLQLKTASQEFFNDEEHLRIDDEKKRVYVSSILDFYTEDTVIPFSSMKSSCRSMASSIMSVPSIPMARLSGVTYTGYGRL
jgi:hypothetical protein